MTDLLTRTLAPAPTPAPEHANEADAPETAIAGTVAHDLVLAVAPSTGRFRAAVLPGRGVAVGEVLGHVTGGGGRADEVIVPVDAVVADLLVRPGQLVRRGEQLAWLHRADGRVA